MKRAIPLALFTFLVAVYEVAGSPLPGNDTKPARYGAVSLVKRLDLDLNEFLPDLVPRGIVPYYLYQGPEGRLVSRFGPGPAVAAAPVFAVALLARGGKVDAVGAIYLAKLTAALCVALAAVFLFLCALRLRATPAQALAVALIYGLGTTALSVVSQALWQHPPAQLFLALGLYLLARDSRGSIAAGGSAFAAAVVCRPADLVWAAAALGWVAWQRRALLGPFVACALPLAAALLAYNAHYLGGPLMFAQAIALKVDAGAPATVWTATPWTGLAGLLVSPSRGLFVYSPIFLFLFWRPRETWRASAPAAKVGLVGAAGLLVVCTAYYRWWGGWSFGYRLLADAAPALSLALLPAIARLGRVRPARVLFAAAAIASVTIHLAAAVCYDPFSWDRDPDVDLHPARLWSVSDAELGYLFHHLRPRQGP